MQICAALIGVHGHVLEHAFKSYALEDGWREGWRPIILSGKRLCLLVDVALIG
jgi:hypothetical protein